MENPARPFERYRTRSALFLMIYAVTALIFGIPNILLLTREDDKFTVILITSLLVVSRYIGYIKLAGYALLEPAKIRKASGRILLELMVIVLVLLVNAWYYLDRFALADLSVTAISFGCLATAGILITHLVASREKGITGSTLMRMVSGVLIAIGAADMVISRVYIIPQVIGLVTLFFGIYTERKSILLALKQTIAAAGSAAGVGMVLHFSKYYLTPGLFEETYIAPPVAIVSGLLLAVVGLGYYFRSRRLYNSEYTA